MDVAPLWFRCKNPECNYIPFKTKKDKIKKAWRYGESVMKSSRQRLFMRNVEGLYIYSNYAHDKIEFQCKYGMILLYDIADTGKFPNSPMEPICDVYECGVCEKKRVNEELLYDKHT